MSGRLDAGPDTLPIQSCAPGSSRGRHRCGDETWTPAVPARGAAAGRHAVPPAERGAAPLPLVRRARHAAPDERPTQPFPLTGASPARGTGDALADTDDLGQHGEPRRPPRSTQTIGLPGVLGRAPYPDGGNTWRTDSTPGGRAAEHRRPVEHGHPNRSGGIPRHPGRQPGGRAPGTSNAADGSAVDTDRPVPGSGAAAPSIVPTAPPQVTVAPTHPALRVQQPVNGRQIASRTISYYRLVTSDPEAAYDLTDGQDGPDTIAERYSGVRSVQVREVYADPNTARTVNDVTIVRDDGSSTTEQRTLTFTRSDDPKIASDG